MPDEPNKEQEVAIDAANSAAVMEEMMKEGAPTDEVEEIDEKTVPAAPIEPEKTPEQEPATTTTPEEEKRATAEVQGKEEVSTEAPKEGETPKEEQIKEEDKDDETLALEKRLESIRLKDSAKPATKKALTEVKNIAKRLHGEKKEERAGRLAAEAKLAEREKLPVLDEEKQKYYSDVENRLKQVDSERTITAEYQPKIQGMAKSAQEAFASSPGVSQGTAKFIEDNGGPNNFRSSNDFMPAGMKDAQGNPIAQHEDGTPFTRREFWAKLIEPFLPPGTVKKLNYFDNESTRLDMERQAKIDEAKQDLDKWEKGRNEQGQLQQKEFSERFEKRAKEYVKDFGNIAQKKEIPTNATLEQKTAIEKKNARVDKAEGTAKRYASNLTPETYAEMTLNSAYVEMMREVDKEKDVTIETLTKRAETAEQKLLDIKNAGKTSNRVSAPIHANTVTSVEDESNDEKRMAMRMQQGK